MHSLQMIRYTFSDTWAITRRNLLRYVRLPQLLFFSSVQPIMFLLLFNFVFGGSIGPNTHVPGGKYINYLLPGILTQVVLFGGLNTGIGLAEDMGKGIIDRFQSLPMSRIAVMAGRTVADAIRNISVVTIMLIVGTLLGFRFQHGFFGALGMVGLAVSFGFAFSWIAAFIGMSVKDSETAQLASFVIVFPLTFASAVFVPLETMPIWLQKFAGNQPVSFMAQSGRELALGVNSHGAIVKLLLWIVGILVVFVPLSIWRYRNRT